MQSPAGASLTGCSATGLSESLGGVWEDVLPELVFLSPNCSFSADPAHLWLVSGKGAELPGSRKLPWFVLGVLSLPTKVLVRWVFVKWVLAALPLLFHNRNTFGH